MQRSVLIIVSGGVVQDVRSAEAEGFRVTVLDREDLETELEAVGVPLDEIDDRADEIENRLTKAFPRTVLFARVHAEDDAQGHD